MRVMVAGTTGEVQFVKSMRGFRELAIRDGDIRAEPKDFSRGDVTRMTMCDAFLEDRRFDAILMVDMDMYHYPDMLEKLRSHNKDMVTAHYWKRKTPMESIIVIGEKWPYIPLK